MSRDEETRTGRETASEGPPREAARRRPYHTPRLERLGDLRSLTLGGSPGAGDSTDPLNFTPLP